MTAGTVVLCGERVVLRGFHAGEARAALDHWLSSRHVVTTRDRTRARRSLARRLERSGRLVDGWLDLAIEAEGGLIGEIGARRPNGAIPPGVFELGIEIWGESARGRGYGSEAVELLTSHLFEAEDAARVQASTAVWNAAMRRVFSKLGFTDEGVMRAFMPTENGRDDYVLYGVTRGEWLARPAERRAG